MRHLTVQQLSASLDGALVGVSLELVVRHLATCRECRDRHARLSKQDDTLRHLLAWDPGAEFFEDASIRIETMLDAESRGVAPARAAEIESQLPRVTLDQLLGGATVASQAPARTSAPRPAAPSVAAVNPPDLSFPDWMHSQAPAASIPVVPTPAIVPVPLPYTQPISQLPQAAPPAPEPVRPAPPAPEPVRAAPPAPEPVRAATTAPHAAPRPFRAPGRRTIPRWVIHIAASAGAIALVLATLSALPPVIRIPAPELPRLPRLEWVRRPTPVSAPSPTVEAHAPQLAVTNAIIDEPTSSAPVPTAAPTAITPVVGVPVDRVPVEGTPLAAKAAVPAPVRVSPQFTAAPEPRRRDPAPTPATRTTTAAAFTQAPPATATRITPAPTVAAATTTSADASVSAGADGAADWPLLCGEVRDDTNTPVAGARVMLADLELSARTDKRGRFCIAAPAGDRTLSVVALGFATARQVVSLGAQTLEVHVALKPLP